MNKKKEKAFIIRVTVCDIWYDVAELWARVLFPSSSSPAATAGGTLVFNGFDTEIVELSMS